MRRTRNREKERAEKLTRGRRNRRNRKGEESRKKQAKTKAGESKPRLEYGFGIRVLTVALHMGVISDPTVDNATISPVLNNIVPNGSMTL